MSEQRYVVEITRPVAPERVERVSYRIADRLSVPVERILTLLDGRAGPVTKPVLADKADAIAEVFGEAGVAVIVSAALMERPPAYQETFADEYTPSESETAAAEEAAEEEPPTLAEPVEPEPIQSEPVEPETNDAIPESQPAAQASRLQPLKPTGISPAPVSVSGGGAVAAAPASAAESGEVQADSEEEADRLGVAPGPGAGTQAPLGPVATAGSQAQEAEVTVEATETGVRFPDAQHDPYAFAPEDDIGFGVFPTPMGPARAAPIEPQQITRAQREPAVGGFYRPEEPQLEARSKVRGYLLWALGVSFMTLILLQFVLANQSGEAPPVNEFERGLVAYRKGEFTTARQVWEPLAAVGHAEAQYFLGYLHQNGLGVPWSNAKAAEWYGLASAQGQSSAQLALGDLYNRGMGVDQDVAHGAALYRRAAEGGDPQGQLEYARVLLHGRGVPRDLGEAFGWFEAAAGNGMSEAADMVDFARHAQVALD